MSWKRALEEWDLTGLVKGETVVLYHGTNKTFQSFDLSLSRKELVDMFYGGAIFFTPEKSVAWKYARANRNIGIEPSVIDDLKKINVNAAAFLQTLYKHGDKGWELYWKQNGFMAVDGSVDIESFDAHLGGVDSNRLGDVASYIVGSKVKPLGYGSSENIFSMSTGAPEWLYDELDRLGLDSKKYRPKVYTVLVRVNNPLITNDNSEARSARENGFDSVIFLGDSIVDDVPEVAVFNSQNIRIKSVEVGE